MSEAIVAAIIGFMGAILGAFITLFGTIIVSQNRKDSPTTCAVLGLSASIGGVIGLLGGLFVGVSLIRETQSTQLSSPTEEIVIQSTNIPVLTPTAPSPPTAKFEIVSIQNFTRDFGPNLGIEPGNKEFLGVPFEFGWVFTTQYEPERNLPLSIEINTNFPTPQNVYFLIQSGNAWRDFANRQMGLITLEFDDGSIHSLPLVLGNNIRDWSREHSTAVLTISAPYVREAHRGNNDGQSGGFDLLQLEIPTEYRQLRLTKVTVTDDSENLLGEIDPAIHLLGITVEYLE